ncbi:hypothetical protein B7Z28_01990, partial [Candidatus Saccharibacteria bacterium 32-45-3]
MKITIIYNPNSTGDSEANARAAYEQLTTHDVTLVATDFAGHGEELAREIAEKNDEHMIISSSGDGGYHEVINGILSAKNHDKIIAGLLPSGNANDHYNAIHDGDLVSRINEKDIRSIDVLKLTAGNVERFAHSYIGFGLSPQIGEELNKTKLNRFNEIWIVLSQFLSTIPVRITYNKKKLRFASLTFSNIHRMAKVLTLSEDAKPDDGIFEVNAIPARSLFTAIGIFAKAAV